MRKLNFEYQCNINIDMSDKSSECVILVCLKCIHSKFSGKKSCTIGNNFNILFYRKKKHNRRIAGS